MCAGAETSAQASVLAHHFRVAISWRPWRLSHHPLSLHSIVIPYNQYNPESRVQTPIDIQAQISCKADNGGCICKLGPRSIRPTSGSCRCIVGRPTLAGTWLSRRAYPAEEAFEHSSRLSSKIVRVTEQRAHRTAASIGWFAELRLETNDPPSRSCTGLQRSVQAISWRP
jgi:hypothetical protein